MCSKSSKRLFLAALDELQPLLARLAEVVAPLVVQSPVQIVERRLEVHEDGPFRSLEPLVNESFLLEYRVERFARPFAEARDDAQAQALVPDVLGPERPQRPAQDLDVGRGAATLPEGAPAHVCDAGFQVRHPDDPRLDRRDDRRILLQQEVADVRATASHASYGNVW